MLTRAVSARLTDDVTPAAGTDEDLARRFATGDAGAFDTLVRRHRDAIYRFVRCHLGAAREEAEDVTQDVLVEMARSLPRHEGRSRLRTWVPSTDQKRSNHQRTMDWAGLFRMLAALSTAMSPGCIRSR